MPGCREKSVSGREGHSGSERRGMMRESRGGVAGQVCGACSAAQCPYYVGGTAGESDDS